MVSAYEMMHTSLARQTNKHSACYGASNLKAYEKHQFVVPAQSRSTYRNRARRRNNITSQDKSCSCALSVSTTQTVVYSVLYSTQKALYGT